ncbi:FG-GAP repeat domain-containing protein [Glycomyces niveus]|uniref:VCBS repeat-containing protein n=1 Tax=Glycomyces niveus TaxID=2820287 RepID=A0ABS3U674_9ACTN|nr:VCBS repeat-containing protein [Glycomyces sp. NEAU-S30]MBO3734287.1 VCBS repeat-containing protein [Glycomyces sp. NEAU-S30]
MNDTPPTKPPRRAFNRAAAAAATFVGAALLTAPGTATAQSDIDCTALGDNPKAGGIAGAFDAAVKCGVEVRISQRSWPHATVYATPEGQLHLVATADATHEYVNQGHLDPTLSVWDGYLSQEFSYWRFTMPYDQDAALFSTPKVAVDWAGEIPVPTYSGTTAVYDELAPGLDFTADVDEASAGLRFTAADAGAWDALAGNLTANLHSESSMTFLVASDGLLFISDHSSQQLRFPEWTTAFTVRDGAGQVASVGLTRDEESGALTFSLPEGFLETAEYPLTLSTQWANRDYAISEWGATTSAAPGLSAYRGEAGLDEPYFQAAGETGTAVVGAYCDDLADPTCAEPHQGGAYWSFGWPQLEAAGLKPIEPLQYSYPVASATFRVDAADASSCVAPDVQLVTGYSPSATWADPPAAVDRPADAGACQDGAAVYDVTESVRYADDAYASSVPLSFGMTDSPETARFDGDSGRLDVYFDIRGFRYTGAAQDICSSSLGSAPYQRTATPYYGDFLVETWRPETLDLGLVWTAAFRDTDTGETVLTIPSRGVAVGSTPEYQVDEADALPDGRYELVNSIESTTSDFTYTAAPCYLVVDAHAPEIVDVTMPATPQQVGETVAIEVTAADAGFPGGWNAVTLECEHGCTIPAGEPLVLNGDDKATVEVELTDTATSFSLTVRDKAGNVDYPGFTVPAIHSHFDYDQDGDQDLFTVRDSDGLLLFHPGNGTGGYGTAKTVGTGWGRMDVVMSGDVTGDGRSDLIGRDTKTGKLYTYPGNGLGGLGTRIDTTGGLDWNGFGPIAVLDKDDDGDLDLIAVLKGNGNLWDFEGNGTGVFTSKYTHGPGWNVMDTLTGIGDYNYDGRDDALARDSRTGVYYLYPGGGGTLFGARIALGTTLGGEPAGTRYLQVTGAGDADGDGHGDFVAVNARTGALERHSVDADATSIHTGEVVSGDWGGLRLPSTTMDLTYDYNGDGATDFVARVGLDGTSYLYPGIGSAGHGTRVSWGTSLAGMTLIATAGDMNADGFADVLARTSGGTLYLYPGTGTGGINTAGRISIGTGWNAMTTLTGGHDYDSDGKPDVIAVASGGTLYLYPGTGDGKVGARKTVGSGWTSMSEVTATGDLDHDGNADMVAVRNADGCLYFYGGKGDGTFKPLVKIGCGWAAMDAVTGVGDFNRDGHVDWLARRKSDGSLFLYPGNGAGNHGAAKLVGTGWNAMTIA